MIKTNTDTLTFVLWINTHNHREVIHRDIRKMGMGMKDWTGNWKWNESSFGILMGMGIGVMTWEWEWEDTLISAVIS